MRLQVGQMRFQGPWLGKGFWHLRQMRVDFMASQGAEMELLSPSLLI